MLGWVWEPSEGNQADSQMGGEQGFTCLKVPVGFTLWKRSFFSL